MLSFLGLKLIDGDEKLEYLSQKIICGEHLTNQDILTLTFVPLMRGKTTKSDRSIKSIILAEKYRIVKKS